MEKITALFKIVPLMVVAVILLGIGVTPSANSATHLPDCKANPKCLVFLDDKWFSITAADVQEMINGGADVNATHNLAVAPLHLAATLGKTEVISVLVKAGADVNARDIDGLTPLIYAKHKKHWSAAKLLEKHGAK